MWALYESYDPATRILYLDLVLEPAVASMHPGVSEPKLLEKFPEVDDAHRFSDAYLKALDYGDGRVICSVQCGRHRMGGCGGQEKPCYLRLDAYHCESREAVVVRPPSDQRVLALGLKVQAHEATAPRRKPPR